MQWDNEAWILSRQTGYPDVVWQEQSLPYLMRFDDWTFLAGRTRLSAAIHRVRLHPSNLTIDLAQRD